MWKSGEKTEGILRDELEKLIESFTRDGLGTSVANCAAMSAPVVERCTKLGYGREGELTLYEAIPTSQLHNTIVLISYVVSCGAFRSS